MQHVAIIGLGLIGGSIGLGLRKWSDENAESGKPALHVVGFDLDLENQSLAKKMGAVDDTEWELRKAVQDADLIIIAVPVLAMRDVFADIAEHLKPGAVVTDTASTKSDVLDWASELLPTTVSFVGGHPMAGKETSLEGADADLFDGSTWCVTPSVSAKEDSVRTVLGMVTALDAESFFVDPAEHDAYVAGISHLPFVASAAIMNALASDSSWKDMKTLTASGFNDMTRLAGGSPEMHRDIALTNKESLDRWLSSLIGELQSIQQTLRSENESVPDEVKEYFEKAQDSRISWAVQTSREAELLGPTASETSGEGLSDQMGRMFFGGFLRKRRFSDGGNEKSDSKK